MNKYLKVPTSDSKIKPEPQSKSQIENIWEIRDSRKYNINNFKIFERWNTIISGKNNVYKKQKSILMREIYKIIRNVPIYSNKKFGSNYIPKLGDVIITKRNVKLDRSWVKMTMKQLLIYLHNFEIDDIKPKIIISSIAEYIINIPSVKSIIENNHSMGFLYVFDYIFEMRKIKSLYDKIALTELKPEEYEFLLSLEDSWITTLLNLFQHNTLHQVIL